jgi:hypothetical protein
VPTTPPLPFTAAPERSGTSAPAALPPPIWANASELVMANAVANTIVRNCMGWIPFFRGGRTHEVGVRCKAVQYRADRLAVGHGRQMVRWYQALTSFSAASIQPRKWNDHKKCLLIYRFSEEIGR